jgi:D-serine deaminase-like pyridoxal phosphate-dependent protein
VSALNSPNTALAGIDAATRHLPAPLAAVDLDAFDTNLGELTRRADGRPIRLASKSVRVRGLIERALTSPVTHSGLSYPSGFVSIMAFSLREAIWLARALPGIDILVGYPTVDRAALGVLATEPDLLARITIMADDAEHLARASAAVSHAGGDPIRVCLDVDASLRVGRGRFRAHLGVRRSPLHEPAEVGDFARQAAATDGVTVIGVMFYEAQIAGLADTSFAVRQVKRMSARELGTRRRLAVEAVQDATGQKLQIVNGGGTGSLEVTAADSVITELTAGSGLFCPTLFDGYRAFDSRPSAFFGLDVVRKPARGIVTAFGGGYIASGPAGRLRLPRPVLPEGLQLIRSEGAGEVQTPVRLPVGRRTGSGSLAVGDRIWWRHAKAGELLERFAEVHLVRAGEVVETVPTYRGEGRTFG